MSDDRRRDILVIGSLNHSRATCIDWMWDFPNIEEFDAVIVNMPSLGQAQFDHVDSYQPIKLPSAKREISTLLNTGRSVYCVYSEPITPTPKSAAGKGVVVTEGIPNCYDWLSFYPEIKKVKPGRSLSVRDQTFERYFQGLDEWQYEIGPPSSDEYYLFRAMPVAVNRSGKMIAARFVRSHRDSTRRGSVYLLPPLTRYSQQEAIELLIEIILGAKKSAEYPWRERIDIPGLAELQAEIGKHREAISKINKEIEEAQKRYLDRESYRDLFSPDDQLQVKAVRRMLSDLRLQTDLTKPAFVVDLIGKDMAVEVTSDAGKITTKSDSLNQVSRFIQQERKQEKVILVANTYSRLPLEERVGKENFSREVKGFLEKLEVCCLSARCLYLLWKKAQEKSMPPENSKNLIFNTVGELAEDEI